MRIRSAGLLCLIWVLSAGQLCAQDADSAAGQAVAVVPHSLDDFLRRDSIEDIRISPDGKHFAIIVPFEDRSILNIVSRADGSTTGYVNPGPNVYVSDFVWVADERILLWVEQKFGRLDTPLPTGEIFATNADGSGQKMLFGFRGEGSKSGTRIDRGRKERASGFVIDKLTNEPKKVLISIWPWTDRAEPYSRIEELDIYSGRRKEVAKAPVQRASFVTDPGGTVRFATGAGASNRVLTYYRASADAEWELLNDESVSEKEMHPLGFSADGATAYLQIEENDGPDGVYSFDTESGESQLAYRSEYADPIRSLRSVSGRAVIGSAFMEEKPKMRFFDRKSADAIVYRTMAANFKGSTVRIDSATADGQEVMVLISSDRSPGDYYLFDRGAKSVNLVFSKGEWINPERTAEVRPFSLKARDGLTLHGYLTIPPGEEASKLPLIVHPHGGPYGVADGWHFDAETQMLAARGYAVLQVNFRGSGGYGRRHMNAGTREWGKAMQDDLTDATKWAIAEGLADGERVCIYGASYGGYAALMAVAKEPDLYQCAVGYIGVYDLPLMLRRGDIQTRRSGRTYLDEALGNQDLASVSPVNLAAQIKVPVFLAAGGEDQRAPVDHTEAMEKALKKAGVPVQTLIYPDEGHGFFVEEHRREFYQRLLAFFDEHIGAE